MLAANTWYEVVISKMTSTPLSQSASGPYTNPFPPSDLASTNTQGVQVKTSGEIGGTLGISNITPQGPALSSLLSNLGSSDKSYTVSIAVRPANDDDSFGPWQLLNPSASSTTSPDPVSVLTDQQLQLLRTGASPLLLGTASDSVGQPLPLGSVDADGMTVLSSGKIRDVYLFNTGIYQGSDQLTNLFDSAHPAFSTSGATQLMQWGIVGYWKAAYDPNGIVANTINTDDVAVSRRLSLANLTPTPPGREYEGTALYVNGQQVGLNRVPLGSAPASISGAVGGSPLLRFDAGAYRLQEISRLAVSAAAVPGPRRHVRPAGAVERAVPGALPQRLLHSAVDLRARMLPVFSFIDNVEVVNLAQGPALTFSPASLDLAGSPAVGRCGPLITPNLYTPPGVALTVCDTPAGPHHLLGDRSTRSPARSPANVNEAYVYVKDDVLMLYAGKKIGDLVLAWVVAGAGRRPAHRLRRGRPAGTDGEPHQQVVVRRGHVGDAAARPPRSPSSTQRGQHRQPSPDLKLDRQPVAASARSPARLRRSATISHPGRVQRNAHVIAPFGVGVQQARRVQFRLRAATTTASPAPPTDEIGTDRHGSEQARRVEPVHREAAGRDGAVRRRPVHGLAEHA